MFEKRKDKSQMIDVSEDKRQESAPIGMQTDDTVPDYGIYNDAIVHTEDFDVVITIPIEESVVTIRAPQSLIAQNATDNIAGRLLRRPE